MLSYRDLFGSAEEANGETIRRIIDSDDEDDPLPAKRAKVETESPSDLLLNVRHMHDSMITLSFIIVKSTTNMIILAGMY